MKRNSIDMRIELLAAARLALAAFERVACTPDLDRIYESDKRTNAWLKLKAAAAQYDEMVTP